MSDIEETKRRVAKLESELEQQKTEFEQLREAMVTTAAVERVLLEYGVEPDAVGSIVDDIEAVDSRLGGDDDE
jgi:predicted RNase H-like nuclease (RuvC/YqgF family)